MGSGEWLTDVYAERARFKVATGKATFDYDDSLKRLPSHLRKVHPTLDPFGVKARESRDSDDHPNSQAVAILFDVTGSMGKIPETLQKKLSELNGLLVRKGYIENPQILFGAIGDIRGGIVAMGEPGFVRGDIAPLQAGQFESDNRMDENLENLYLEGGGNGQKRESYGLADYFIARHTDIDCWNKRRRKGYFFTIGDEMAWLDINRFEVKKIIGDHLAKDVSLEEIVREVRQRYHRYHIYPLGASYDNDPEVEGFWKKLLGEGFLKLDDPEAVCETIALQIGINEGRIDLDEGVKHLQELGVPKSTRLTVRRALATGSKPTVRGTVSLPGLTNKSLGEPK